LANTTRFPSPLETERLIIRTPCPDDAPALNEAIQETWDALHRWMIWASTPQDLEFSKGVCERMQQSSLEGRDYPLFCFERSTGDFVLSTGCHPRKMDIPSFEIGYWCRQSMQGKAYVTEAVRAISEAAFEVMGARRIEIRCDKENHASYAVAERCGYVREGELKNDCRDTSGALRTTLIFALTRDDPPLCRDL
jgi:RimJ/RimL family protein N-acetyltransferase